MLAAACTPNPRGEIPDIAVVALREIARTAGGRPLCVDRTIAPWQPAAQTGRTDPPAPPGYAALYSDGVFRGGGGVKGASVGGVAVAGRADCLKLRGPLIAGDRAMVEVDSAADALNLWLRRERGGWHVVMTTSSVYPR